MQILIDEHYALNERRSAFRRLPDDDDNNDDDDDGGASNIKPITPHRTILRALTTNVLYQRHLNQRNTRRQRQRSALALTPIDCGLH